MLKSKSKKLVIFTVLMQLSLYTGCTTNKADTNQTNQQQATTTTVDTKAINDFSVATKNTTRIIGKNAEEILDFSQYSRHIFSNFYAASLALSSHC